MPRDVVGCAWKMVIEIWITGAQRLAETGVVLRVTTTAVVVSRGIRIRETRIQMVLHLNFLN